MTIRTKKTGGTTVHAGPAAELAALALEYAAGQRRTVTADEQHHFEAAAERLRTGHFPAESGPGHVRFWCDRADGTPFQGPRGYRPDPDPDWLAANPHYSATPTTTRR